MFVDKIALHSKKEVKANEQQEQPEPEPERQPAAESEPEPERQPDSESELPLSAIKKSCVKAQDFFVSGHLNAPNETFSRSYDNHIFIYCGSGFNAAKKIEGIVNFAGEAVKKVHIVAIGAVNNVAAAVLVIDKNRGGPGVIGLVFPLDLAGLPVNAGENAVIVGIGLGDGDIDISVKIIFTERNGGLNAAGNAGLGVAGVSQPRNFQ